MIYISIIILIIGLFSIGYGFYLIKHQKEIDHKIEKENNLPKIKKPKKDVAKIKKYYFII